MSVVHRRSPVLCCTPEPQAELYKRQAPHRKHFYSWVATDRRQLEITERLLLRGLPYYQARIAGLNTISTDDIRGCDDDLAATADTSSGLRAVRSSGDLANIAAAAEAEEEVDTRDVLVLVHGFAGGVAGWAQNWRFFAEHFRVYAMDLPGFARSERRAHRATSVQTAMNFVCGYLERWFQRLRFGKPVIVLAHSFGCFVAAHYAMRCGPAEIKQLCLTEPWGMVRGDRNRVKKYPLLLQLMLTLFYHVSPLALLRAAGPGGPQLLRHTRPDFDAKWKSFLDNTDPLYDYLYHCNAQRSPVGETLFQACCHYDVCAKEPLQDVLPFKLDKRIRVMLLFGGTSWLAPGEAMEMATVMRAKSFHVLVDTLPTAGHQVFTDDVDGFNEKVLDMLNTLAADSDTGDVKDIHEEPLQ
ncbi:putative mitochondrial hypothetical protein [Leptomonas pyrrhocoris]|uniref:AB hydrolase-1 domain-containing protein n=1 Tax=Leptomonas pyrrhocoris TaxID=157538 RepID=A0A0M9G7S2_LEPPY|nr:putative mitochondrial hypothetical protein [Leptomonas pyrrhocoris]KPA84146.1 putative mitochondrial hypothetical protein [Leptomonas pyrrhocoris]|eukprot:XP_015662585.1 putative mitochondrial hypothetical protein [Leptomonas pyrrhocoris]